MSKRCILNASYHGRRARRSVLILLRPPVVFIAIDPRALAILLAVDLPALLSRQLSTVSLAIHLHFVMNRRLLLFQMRRFVRRERTVLHSFANPLLLISLPLVHLL